MFSSDEEDDNFEYKRQDANRPKSNQSTESVNPTSPTTRSDKGSKGRRQSTDSFKSPKQSLDEIHSSQSQSHHSRSRAGEEEEIVKGFDTDSDEDGPRGRDFLDETGGEIRKYLNQQTAHRTDTVFNRHEPQTHQAWKNVIQNVCSTFPPDQPPRILKLKKNDGRWFPGADGSQPPSPTRQPPSPTQKSPTHAQHNDRCLVFDCLPSVDPKSIEFKAVEGQDGKKRLGITALFESGNVALAWAGTPHRYHLFLDCDVNTNGYTQWFYFAVGSKDGSEVRAGRRVVFVVENLSKACPLFTEGMKPVVWSTKDGTGWHQIEEEVTYNFGSNQVQRDPKHPDKPVTDPHHHGLEWGYTFKHDGDVCFFALAYPYTYSHLQAYLGKLLAHPYHSRWIRHSSLCETIAGLRCDVLEISDWDSPDVVGKEKRPAAIVTARVHPGETNGSWMMQGFLNFLTGKSKQAQVLRQRMVWHVVPMLNPDGVVYGNTRCGLSGVDLNRQFMKPSRQLQPTIFYLKRRMQDILRDGRRMEFYFDFHGHSKKRGIFFYGNQYPTDSTSRWKNARVRLFPKLVSLASDDVIYDSCDYSALSYKDSTGRVTAFRDFEILYSYTIEASFFGPDPRKKHEEAMDVARVGSYWKQQEQDEATFGNANNVKPRPTTPKQHSSATQHTIERAPSPELAEEQPVTEKKKRRGSVVSGRPAAEGKPQASKRRTSSSFPSGDKNVKSPENYQSTSSVTSNKYVSNDGVENLERKTSKEDFLTQRPKSPSGSGVRATQGHWHKARAMALMTTTLASAKGVKGNALAPGDAQGGVPVVTSISDNAELLVELRDMLGELTGDNSKPQHLVQRPPSAHFILRRVSEVNEERQKILESKPAGDTGDREQQMMSTVPWKSPKCFSWKRLLCVGPALGHAIVSQFQLQRLVERAGPLDAFPCKGDVVLRGDAEDESLCCTCCAADAVDDTVYEFHGDEAQLPFLRFDRLQGRLATALVQRVMGDADKEQAEGDDVHADDASGSDSDPEKDQKPAEELKRIHQRIRTRMKRLEITKKQDQILGNEKLLVAFGRTERISVRDDRFRALMAEQQRRSNSAPPGSRVRPSAMSAGHGRRPRSAPLEEPGRVRFRFVSSRDEASIHWWDAVWTNSSSSEGSGGSDGEGLKRGDDKKLPELMTKVRQERDIREVYAQADDAFNFEYTPFAVRSCVGRAVDRTLQGPKQRGHSRFRQRRLQFAYAACADALTSPGKAIVGPFPPSSRSAVAARHFKRDALESQAQRKHDDLILTVMLKQEDPLSSGQKVPHLTIRGHGKRFEANDHNQAPPARPDSRSGSSNPSTAAARSNTWSRSRLQPLNVDSRPGSAVSQASSGGRGNHGAYESRMPTWLLLGTLTPNGPKMHMKAQIVRAMEFREDWIPCFVRHKPLVMKPACLSHPRLVRDGPGPPPPSPSNKKNADQREGPKGRERFDTDQSGCSEEEDDFMGPAIVVADDMFSKGDAFAVPNSRPGSAVGSVRRVRQMSKASINSDAISQASWTSNNSGGRPSSASSGSASQASRAKKKPGGRLLRPGRFMHTAWDGGDVTMNAQNATPESGVTSAAGSESGRASPRSSRLAEWSDVSTATSRNARELASSSPIGGQGSPDELSTIQSPRKEPVPSTRTAKQLLSRREEPCW